MRVDKYSSDSVQQARGTLGDRNHSSSNVSLGRSPRNDVSLGRRLSETSVTGLNYSFIDSVDEQLLHFDTTVV